MLRVQGHNELALDRCHEPLALFDRAGDRHGEAIAKIATGAVWLAWGCYAPAGRWFSDAYKLSAAIGDRHRKAHALKRLALLQQHRGNISTRRSPFSTSSATTIVSATPTRASANCPYKPGISRTRNCC
jgi:hypothetical protein